LANRFTADAAKTTGKSERTIQREIARAEKIPGLADVVGTSLDTPDELDRLAKLPAATQGELIQRAKAGENITAKQDKEIHDEAKEVRAKKFEDTYNRKVARLIEISGGNAPLSSARRYPVILADPPWKLRLRYFPRRCKS
jgi:hypothetical protein